VTEDQCVENGGHCWVEADYGITTAVGTMYFRHCKHCNANQTGTEQPRIKWVDA